MKKVVVTGAAGFIGSHLVDELIQRNFQVKAVDVILPQYAPNIKHLFGNRLFEYDAGNIMDASFLEAVLKNADYVFHLAGSYVPITCLADQINYYKDNTNSTLQVLQSALDSRVKKVVFASSCAVYGSVQAEKLSEDMLPQPQTPYAVGKLVSESYFNIFNTFHGLPTVVLRYFNVYGPRQNPDSPLASVIPRFIRMIKQGKGPIIFGDGEQTRDFVYIQDVVDANLLAIENNLGGTYNIGSEESTSIKQLFDLISKLLGREDVKPVYEKCRSGDIKHSLADITKARSAGFNPRYTLEKGLKELLGLSAI